VNMRDFEQSSYESIEGAIRMFVPLRYYSISSPILRENRCYVTDAPPRGPCAFQIGRGDRGDALGHVM
jgi:hypothetical protein